MHFQKRPVFVRISMFFVLFFDATGHGGKSCSVFLMCGFNVWMILEICWLLAGLPMLAGLGDWLLIGWAVVDGLGLLVGVLGIPGYSGFCFRLETCARHQLYHSWSQTLKKHRIHGSPSNR